MRALPVLAVPEEVNRNVNIAFPYWPASDRAVNVLSVFRAYQTAVARAIGVVPSADRLGAFPAAKAAAVARVATASTRDADALAAYRVTIAAAHAARAADDDAADPLAASGACQSAYEAYMDSAKAYAAYTAYTARDASFYEPAHAAALDTANATLEAERSDWTFLRSAPKGSVLSSSVLGRPLWPEGSTQRTFDPHAGIRSKSKLWF